MSSRKILLGLAAIVSFPLLLTACSSPSASPQAPVTVRLDLNKTSVTSGTPIKGVVTFTNTTGHPITLSVPSCTLKGLFEVGLSNKQVPLSMVPIWKPPCHPIASLAPGSSQFTVNIPTTYQGCLHASASNASGTGIGCMANGNPLLCLGASTRQRSIKSACRSQPSCHLRPR
jgi:hypothetical protein